MILIAKKSFQLGKELVVVKGHSYPLVRESGDKYVIQTLRGQVAFEKTHFTTQKPRTGQVEHCYFKDDPEEYRVIRKGTKQTRIQKAGEEAFTVANEHLTPAVRTLPVRKVAEQAENSDLDDLILRLARAENLQARCSNCQLQYPAARERCPKCQNLTTLTTSVN